MIRLEVMAEPFGKQRPRSRPGGRPFTPAKTIREELRVREAWQEQSGFTFPRGVPLAIFVSALLRRPQAHYKTSGGLSASGVRQGQPTKKPDWDNVAKLVGDALNGYAYHDDAQIVYAQFFKAWCGDGDAPRTLITLQEHHA